MEIIANNIGEGLRVELLRPKYKAGELVWFVIQGRPVEGMVVGYQVDVLQSGKVESYNYRVGFVQFSPEGYSPAFHIIQEEMIRKTKEELLDVILRSVEEATVSMPDEYVPLFMDFVKGIGKN